MYVGIRSWLNWIVATEQTPSRSSGCSLCGHEGDDDTILLCDGCDQEFHMACLTPRLLLVPRGDFYCFNCINKTASIDNQVLPGEYSIVKETRTSNKPTKYKEEGEEPQPIVETTTSKGNRTSRYRGVAFRVSKDRWVARINSNKNGDSRKRIIGYYETEVEAAKAYDVEALKEQGHRARLNFPLLTSSSSPEHEDPMRGKRKGTTAVKAENDGSRKKYRGVSFHGSKVQASLYIRGKSRYLGSFDTALDAAVAYDRAIMKHGGPVQNLNFPEQYDLNNLSVHVADEEENPYHKAIDQVCEQQKIQVEDAKEWMSKLQSCSEIQQVMKMDDAVVKKMNELNDGLMQEIQSYLERIQAAKSFQIPDEDLIPTPVAFPLNDADTLDSFLSLTRLAAAFSQCKATSEDEFNTALSDLLTEAASKPMTNVESNVTIPPAALMMKTEAQNIVSRYVSLPDRYGIACAVPGSSDCKVLMLDDATIETRRTDESEHSQVSEEWILRAMESCIDKKTEVFPKSYAALFQWCQKAKAYFEKEMDTVNAKINQNKTTLMENLARSRTLKAAHQQFTNESLAETAKTENVKQYASRDAEFLRVFCATFDPFLAQVMQRCEAVVEECLLDLRNRAKEFAAEFTYHTQALQPLMQQPNRTSLEQDYYEFFMSELKMLWSERTSALEALYLLKRSLDEAITSEDTRFDRPFMTRVSPFVTETIQAYNAIHWPSELNRPMPLKVPTFAETLQQLANGQESTESSVMTRVLYHPECVNHVTPSGHPECPQRMVNAIEILHQVEDLHPSALKIERLTQSVEELAPSDSTLLMVHSPSYLQHLRQRATEAADDINVPLVFETHTERGTSTVQHLETRTTASNAFNVLTANSGAMDTYVSANSWNVALLAAGTVCLAVDKVMSGECRNAVCLVRPPGHHVGRDGRTTGAPSSGFCLLNNVIVGSMHARTYPNIRKCAVIDWDIHHGNGTEELMRGDKDAFFASIHLFTGLFFPGTGDDHADDNIVNVALRNQGIGSGSRAFRQALSNVVLPAMDTFAPDIIFISAGFDGHKHDIIGGMAAIKNTHVPAGYDEADYCWATHEIQKIADKHCSGRIVSVLEGGYDIRRETNSLAKSIAAHIDAIVTGPSTNNN